MRVGRMLYPQKLQQTSLSPDRLVFAHNICYHEVVKNMIFNATQLRNQEATVLPHRMIFSAFQYINPGANNLCQMGTCRTASVRGRECCDWFQ
jgi:hypothetical protein